MRSRIATASKRNIRHQPLAFTEHGVVMLSAVLNSKRAVQMSIVVVKAFVRMRELVAANKVFGARIRKLEQNHGRAVSVIEILAEDIDRLTAEVEDIKTLPPASRTKIGFTR